MLEFEVTGSSVVQEFSATRVVVVGVGGAGGNTVNALLSKHHEGYQCMVINTDAQALDASRAPHRLRIGARTTKGRGAGADPELGRAAAEEDLAQIIEAIGDAELVFLTGGLGGGTGTGALPVIAQALKERDILTVCIVTKPFSFEGKRRMLVADQAEVSLRAAVDTLITIPNEKLMQINASVAQSLSLMDAFGMVNTLVGDCVRGIVDIIVRPGHINVDFADVKMVMKGMGAALMGTARAAGEDRALQAAHAAVTSPFLDGISMRGARSVLINVTGGNSLGLHEVQRAVARITEDCDEHATIIIGSVIDDAMGDEVAITVLATGFAATAHKGAPVDFVPRPTALSEQQLADQKAALAKNHPLREILSRDAVLRDAGPRETLHRDMASDLEKRLREQYALSQEELEVPTLLRKLLKEQANNK